MFGQVPGQTKSKGVPKTVRMYQFDLAFHRVQSHPHLASFVHQILTPVALASAHPHNLQTSLVVRTGSGRDQLSLDAVKWTHAAQSPLLPPLVFSAVMAT